MEYNPVGTFLQEAEELLAEIEQSALAIETEGAIHHLFRAFHTIKGSGAMCGLDAIARFTHHVESLLDKAREGSIPASPELGRLVLKSRDHIKMLLDAEQGGSAGSPALPPESGEQLIALIEGFAHAGLAGAKPDTCADEPAGVHVLGHEQGGASCALKENTWLIRFRPSPGLLACGGNPVALLNELRELGHCEIVASADEVPALDAIQPDVCYLSWTITLRGACEENAIRDVFIFVEDGSQLEIESVKPQPVENLSPQQHASAVEEAAIAPSSPGSAALPQKTHTKESTVRVPSTRLDRLVNLVGELVMNQSRLAQAASQSGAPEFTNPVQELERLVAELRDNVLGIRMLPIGTLFGRFRRLVHDLSQELNKEVDLVTEGSDTELDKSILDQLGEPLVHCLRNCLDHAIEPAEERLAKGKPRRGVIRLSAVHTGSDVVIGIQDDGRGIDRAAVRARAVDKQLIAPDASLSDKDILNLILLPGFSTAKQITSVSGRGVGMDAVKRQIDALRGSLSIASEHGKGTQILITLPLTLAIIEGLLMQIGEDQFIVPLAAVTENVELVHSQRARNNGRNVIAVRGELIPYIDLRRAFRIEGEIPPLEKVVIVRHEDQRVGLVVDRVLGTHQTVIQSLGRFYRNIEVVSGATIMGNGRVALIMDVAAIVRHADNDCRGANSGSRAPGELVAA
jgi:two-component system chemotaxis sensor kinase CheA